MAKLNSKQKQQIVADRVDGMSIRALADKYEVSTTTIQNVCKADPELTQKFTDKKKQNTQDVLAYLDSKVGAFKRFSDYIFDERLNPETNREELAKMPLPQLITVLGVASDKMLKSKEIAYKTKEPDDGAEQIAKVNEILVSIRRTAASAKDEPDAD